MTRRASVKEKGALSWLNKSTKKYHSYIGFLTALEVIVSMIGICYALVMKQMVDRAVAKDGYGFTMGMAGFALSDSRTAFDPVHNKTAFRVYQKQHGE